MLKDETKLRSTSDQLEDGEDYPNARYAWYVVGVLTLAYTFSFIDRQILNLLVEPIRNDLGLSDTQISLLQGLAFALFYTTLGVPIGILADRKSRRLIIGCGIFFWSLMTAGCGLARSFWSLFGFRVGVGVGEAALSPAAYSMITDYFPPEKVTRAITVYTGGTFLGAGLSYIIGGYVIEMVGSMGAISIPVLGSLRAWQLAFIVVGLPGILIALLMVTVREPRRRGLILQQGEAREGVPIGEVLAFVHAHWRIYLSHFGGFSAIVLVAYAALAWTPTYFIRIFGWSAGDVGLIYGLVILIFGTGGVISAGWISDRIRAKGYKDANLRITIFGSLVLLPLGVAATLMPVDWMAVLLIVPVTFLWALPLGIGPAALQSITPNQMRAQISALYLLTINLVGLGLGPLSVALFTDYVFGDPSDVKYALSAVSAIGAPLCALLLWRGLPHYRASLDEADRGWGESVK
jgi:MFS family permease